MSTRVVRNGEGHQWPGGVKEVRISCDSIDCSVSLNDLEISAGGGLKKLGWTHLAVPGDLRHYCPNHSRPTTKE